MPPLPPIDFSLLPPLPILPLAAGLTWIDWAVLVGYFVVVTVVGERLAGKQATISDFFLGGNKLPWYAVAGSMIATEISAVTFVGVPAIVFGLGGDFTYLQLGLIAGLLARVFIAWVLVPAYYKQRVFSPYDYMGNQLGGGVRGVMTALFSFGGVLAQASRVYLTAIILELVLAGPLGSVEAYTGLSPLASSVILIGVVAVIWTTIGGIATVIWTDVALFLIFVIGGLIAVIAVASDLGGGFGELVRLGTAGDKFRLFDLDLSFSPTKEFTIWTAAIGTLFGNIGAYGTDQLLAQRLFCCKNEREAKKAILASYLGQGVTALMLLVGVGLWAYYKGEPALEYERPVQVALDEQTGAAEDAAALERRGVTVTHFGGNSWGMTNTGNSDPVLDTTGTSATVSAAAAETPPEAWARPLPEPRATQFDEKNDRIFPIFILSDAIPVGLTGLILAGIFAAAISSFDSILAALSQTTLSAAYLPWLNRRRQRLRGFDAAPGTDDAPQRGPTVREGGGRSPLPPDAATTPGDAPPEDGGFAAHPPSRSGLVAGPPEPPQGVPEERLAEHGDESEARHVVFVSRLLVLFWAVILCLVAFFIDWYQDKFDLPILSLALGLASWVQGGLLAAFFLAWLPLNINGRGLVWAAPLSVLCVMSLQFHETWANVTMWAASGILLVSWVVAAGVDWSNTRDDGRLTARLLKTPILAAGCALLMWISYEGDFNGTPLAWPWWAMVGGLIAFTLGYLLADPKTDARPGFDVLPARGEPA